MLCAAGSAASARAREIVPGLLRARIGEGDVLLQAIMTAAGPLLRLLDDLGEGIDAYFFDRFGVSFADLMGDVAAELIATCPDLEIDRRKFVAFLTSALMGICVNALLTAGSGYLGGLVAAGLLEHERPASSSRRFAETTRAKACSRRFAKNCAARGSTAGSISSAS